MNFQASKRIMCCLLAALILCCTVIRPIEASATGLGAVATGATVVGISPALGVAGILAALGVGYVASGEFEELVSNIVENIPADFIIETMSGTEMLEGISYNDVCYVYQEVAEWVNDYLYVESTDNSNAIVYPSTNAVTSYDEMYNDAMTTVRALGGNTAALTQAKYLIELVDTNGVTHHIWSPSSSISQVDDLRLINLTAPYVVYEGGGVDVSGSLESGETTYVLPNAYPSSWTAHELATESSYDVSLSERISAILDGETYAEWLARSLTLADTTTAVLPIPLGDDVKGTGSISQAIAQTGTVAPSTTYEDTEEIVYVEVPDVSNDLSGIIALLKAILEVLNNIYQTCAVSIKSWIESSTTAITSLLTTISGNISTITARVAQVIPDLLSQVKTAITTGVSDIITTITDTIAEVIAKLLALGATLADILSAIKALATTIAEAIADALTAVFVPSADFITAKVEALRARFDWINPFMDFAQNLSFDGSEPPIIYIHLDAAEGSYYFGETIPFLDMRWYARYKATGDAIISGFLWMLFGWRMYLKLPGIISGAGGAVGHISR